MVTTDPVLETALQGFARWGAVRRPGRVADQATQYALTGSAIPFTTTDPRLGDRLPARGT